MEISNNLRYNNYNYSSVNKSTERYNKNIQADSFSFSGAKNKSSVSFGGGFFNFILKRIEHNDTVVNMEANQNATPYAKDLSMGIKNVLGKNIPAANLSSIMSPDDFRDMLPFLSADNFTAPKKNIENSLYCIDLDYQSNFSRGNENVFDILDKATNYANKYYEETGRDFIFALTDRDTLEGIQHAIRIIGEDPEKYKHLKLLPSVKISYAHEAPNSKLKYENSDILVYGINPFSINLSNFIETTISKRKAMILGFIKQVSELYPEFAYNVIEFAKQNNIKYKKDYTVSNLYWRAREYSETKGETEIKGISKVPEEVKKEAEAIINNLGKIYVGSQSGGLSVTGSEIYKESDLNKTIEKVFEEYSTHLDSGKGKVVSSAENLFDDLIDCLSLEPYQPTLALSAPFYLSHYHEAVSKKELKDCKEFPKVVEFIKDMQFRSNGMLKAFESVAPSYDLDKDLTQTMIDNFNNYIRDNTNLNEVGGSFAKLN